MRPIPLLAALCGVLMLAACAADREAANIQLVQRMVDAVNARDLDALDALVAADVHRHSAATPGVVIENLDQFKAFLRQDFASVPDSRMTVERALADDDEVAVLATYRGTQDGPLGPFLPSHRTVELPFISILRIADGKIIEMWVEWDNLSMLTRLGHLSLPAPET